MVELLSPASNADVAIAAINAGADAVYMGGPAFGARSRACNSLQALERAVIYAHRFGCRVFLTLNTLLYEREIPEAVELARQAGEMGVDAILLQDLGLFRALLSSGAALPELHASTQCHIDSIGKARYLEALGFKRLVLARELSLREIAAIKGALRPETEIETFIHGALCVCYSGLCYMSAYLCGRSGNRGDCAQSCRLPYDLVDARGRTLLRDKHLLSMKDLNADTFLEDLVSLGVNCLKIEGRLKDADYVKNVTLYYRRRLDKILSGRSVGEPASRGLVLSDFTPDLDKTFHREYCTFNLSGERGDWAVFETPKATGERVGRIVRTLSYKPGVFSGLCIEVEPAPGVVFTPGDGLCWPDAGGSLRGFTLERVDSDPQGRQVPQASPSSLNRQDPLDRQDPQYHKTRRVLRLYGRSDVPPAENTPLYRNGNKAFRRELHSAEFTRTLPVYAVFDADTHTFSLRDEIGRKASVTLEPARFRPAENPASSRENFKKQLGKLGGTRYYLAGFEYKGGEALFLPASVLNAVRRDLVERLDKEPLPSPALGHSTSRKPISRLPAPPLQEFPPQGILPIPGQPLMVCKHCIRAQLRQCLKKDRLRPEYRGDLYIRTANRKFALKFDCTACRMEVWPTE